MDPTVKALLETMQADRLRQEERERQQLEAMQAKDERQEEERKADRALIQQLLNREPVVQGNGQAQQGDNVNGQAQVVPAVTSLHKDLSERMEKFVFDAEEGKTFDK
jgi:hypothetical protein